MPTETQHLSGIIAALYDASLDPVLWPAALLGCRHYVGGSSACVYSKSLSGAGAQVFFEDGGIDPRYKAAYFERYVTLDPTNAGHIFAELEQPVSIGDLFSEQEFAETRFYREWVSPQGYVDFISAPIEKVGDWAVMVGIYRNAAQGMVDEAARERMRHVVPHIRRAVLIGRVIETADSRADTLGEALDGLSAAMFLVDTHGRIVHANQAGARMLGEGRGIVARQGRLTARDRAAAHSLEDVFLSAGDGDEAIGTRGISIPIAVEEEHFVAHVLPLTSGARRLRTAQYSAAAAVFVHPATLHSPGAPELIAKTYGLTLGELRVLCAMVQLAGVAETAEALGIAETTVKTHLQRIFAKTGTTRQADLVKLVFSFAGPLRQ